MGVAELLLEMGADVETPDNYGQSPFFMACWKGHSEVAGLLLEFDANKDCRTKTGITPLFQVLYTVYTVPIYIYTYVDDYTGRV